MALRELDCGLCTKLWCTIMKENALFSFIWTGPAALIAPDSALGWVWALYGLGVGSGFMRRVWHVRGQLCKWGG